jgi:hypothetical protein
LKGISSEILTRFGFRDNQEMRWKEIIDTSITRNSNNRIRATQLPIVCSTVGQINERLWNVSVNQFYEQEKEFFHHLSEQVKQCGSLITHHQATCFCLFDHHLSQFYSQYIRRKWIPLYIYELLLKWSQERGTTGEEKKRSEHEMILTELFDQIHIESSGMELLNRIQFIAIELASDDQNNPLLTFSLPSTIITESSSVELVIEEDPSSGVEDPSSGVEDPSSGVEYVDEGKMDNGFQPNESHSNEQIISPQNEGTTEGNDPVPLKEEPELKSLTNEVQKDTDDRKHESVTISQANHSAPEPSGETSLLKSFIDGLIQVYEFINSPSKQDR